MSRVEALTQALVLAITANSEANERRAVTLAEELSRGLNEVQVARAKNEARKRVGLKK